MDREALRTSRVDQVGSLLRPPELIDSFLAHGRGELSADELADRQDDAIRAVVADQERHGVPILSDGEYRRLNWQVSFSDVDGWEQWSGSWAATLANPSLRGAHERPHTKADNAVITYGVPATGKLRLVDSFPLVFCPNSTFTLVGRWGQVDLDGNRMKRATVGLNFRPIESVVFKVDYQFNNGTGTAPASADDDAFVLSLASFF